MNWQAATGPGAKQNPATAAAVGGKLSDVDLKMRARRTRFVPCRAIPAAFITADMLRAQG